MARAKAIEEDAIVTSIGSCTPDTMEETSTVVKKTETVVEPTQKKRRGRPPKNAQPVAPVSEEAVTEVANTEPADVYEGSALCGEEPSGITEETPVAEKKKPGRKPKVVVDEEPEIPSGPVNKGRWSSPRSISIPKTDREEMYIEICYLTDALGTRPQSKTLLSDHLGKLASKEQLEEELADLDEMGVEPEAKFQKPLIYPKGRFLYDKVHNRYIDISDKIFEIQQDEDTGEYFYRNAGSDDEWTQGVIVDNVPFYYDYQIRGFMKDACGLLRKVDADTVSKKTTAYKATIDGNIFVHPRRIAIQLADNFIEEDGYTETPVYDENGNLRVLERPIRITNRQGVTTAIAASEMIPAGSTMKFQITMNSKKLKAAVVEWLGCGNEHGISGWRNSGKGSFIWRELKPDWTPYEDDEVSD